MGEALIIRKGGSGGGEGQLRTEIITGSTVWTMPKCKDNKISVRIFGGGGYAYNGGGSGWMNNGEFTITPGTNINIIIGTPGNENNVTGGTTAFGTYLSANGGMTSDGGAGGPAGRGYQFGGGGGLASMYNAFRGGDGGQWGGGGGGKGGNEWSSSYVANGGNGGTYGGGGGGGIYVFGSSSMFDRGNGGNGGTYGGGGGCGVILGAAWGSTYTINSHGNAGKGGTYGGNASNNSISKNGTNTLSYTNITAELRGAGLGGNKYIHGTINNRTGSWIQNAYSLGGGGYGGNAGTYVNIPSNATVHANGQIDFRVNESYDPNYSSRWYIGIAGSGGGGYGGHGGNTLFRAASSRLIISGAGGGGYGGNGGNSNYTATYGIGSGGGGYFSDGDEYGGGGGYYNYAHGGSLKPGGYLGFGSGSSNHNGDLKAVGGAAIIQYQL